MEVRTSIDLAAPPEHVFDLLLDVERLGDWVSAHEELVEPPGGELAEGSTFTQKLRLGGIAFKVRWEVAKLERPRLVEWRERPGWLGRPGSVLARAGWGGDAVRLPERFLAPRRGDRAQGRRRDRRSPRRAGGRALVGAPQGASRVSGRARRTGSDGLGGSALLVLDMLNPYEHEHADRLAKAVPDALEGIQTLLNRAAAADVPFIYVNDNYGDWNSSAAEPREVRS